MYRHKLLWLQSFFDVVRHPLHAAMVTLAQPAEQLGAVFFEIDIADPQLLKAQGLGLFRQLFAQFMQRCNGSCTGSGLVL